jgi:site-specific recombinase XerD
MMNMSNDEIIKYWEECMIGEKRSEETIRKYINMINNQFRTFINDKSFTEVGRMEIDKFIWDGKSQNSKLNRKAYLHSFYSFLVNKEIMKELPIAEGKWGKIKVPKRKPKSLKRFEMEIILDFLKKKPKYSVVEYTIVCVMYYTACRRKEVTRIKLEDFNFGFDTNYLRIIGKGDKERFVPFVDDLRKIIERYLERTEIKSGYLFPGDSDGHISLNKVNYLFDKIIHKNTGIKVTPHMLRYTWAVLMLRNGMTKDKIQQYLGHEDIKTTERYCGEFELDQMIQTVRVCGMNAFVK